MKFGRSESCCDDSFATDEDIEGGSGLIPDVGGMFPSISYIEGMRIVMGQK